MKLMLCRACGDVVKLQPTPRTCVCGKSSGHYACFNPRSEPDVTYVEAP